MDYKDYLAGKSESNFWFRSRRDLIDFLLKNYLHNLHKKLKILSIGAGTGDELYPLNKFGEIYVIDIEKRALDLIPSGLYKEKKICDARNISYPDGFFDLVVAFDVFEHIKNDKSAVNEAYRVLKKKGTLIFSVPAFQFLYSAHDKALGHKRRYSKNKLKILLKKFNKIKIFYWNFILFLPIVIIRLIRKSSKPKVDNPKLSPFIDKILYKIFKLENFLIKKNFKTLFGITIFGVYTK